MEGGGRVWVCGLARGADQLLLHVRRLQPSLSADTPSCPSLSHRTIKVWRAGHVVATLEGHEGPVLCLAVTPEGDLLTGSGDQTVRRWRDGQCVHVYRGHTDSVRRAWALEGTARRAGRRCGGGGGHWPVQACCSNGCRVRALPM